MSSIQFNLISGIFKPDWGGAQISFTPLNPTPTLGSSLSFIPTSADQFALSTSIRGVAEVGGLSPQSGKIIAESAQSATFFPDAAGSIVASYSVDSTGGGQTISGVMLQGLPEKFQPDSPSSLSTSESHGLLTLRSGGAPISGSMGASPVAPVESTLFTRDPSGSSMASFVPDLDPAAVLKGLYITSTDSSSATFKMFETFSTTIITTSTIIVRTETYGTMTLSSASSVSGGSNSFSGFLTPPNVAGQPATFTPDAKVCVVCVLYFILL